MERTRKTVSDRQRCFRQDESGLVLERVAVDRHQVEGENVALDVIVHGSAQHALPGLTGEELDSLFAEDRDRVHRCQGTMEPPQMDQRLDHHRRRDDCRMGDPELL